MTMEKLKDLRRAWIEEVKGHIDNRVPLVLSVDELESLLLVLSTDIDMS